MDREPKSQGKAWVTLLTRTSYVPGCLVLAASLRRHHSAYPLVVLVEPLSASPLHPAPLPLPVRQLLTSQGLALREIEPLAPASGTYEGPDSRFADTWTKLRFAELLEFERVVLLDCDMLVRGNMDELMDVPLREGEIAAAHACTCNPRKLPHYPADWIPSHCAHTHAQPAPAALARSTPLQPGPAAHGTLHTLNSGLVAMAPSRATSAAMLRTLHTHPAVPGMRFPDQDLLSLHFRGRVRFLGYEYNALKTLRDCHRGLWRDGDVRNVHYILDKPWSKRRIVTVDDLTEVENWWWDEFERVERGWEGTREEWGVVEGMLNAKRSDLMLN